jgi:hypothetical protein
MAHCDIGLTGEAMGIAIGHPKIGKTGYVTVYYDMLLRIKGSPGAEVDLGAVLEFFEYLRRIGFEFGLITFDRYESRRCVQELLEKGFTADYLSVGLEHYKVLRGLLRENRVNYYQHPVLIRELVELRRDEPDMNKPNVHEQRPRHPPSGSDDMADAVAAVASLCVGKDAFQRAARFSMVSDSVVSSLTRLPLIEGYGMRSSQESLLFPDEYLNAGGIL